MVFLKFCQFLVIMPRKYIRKTAVTLIDVPNLVEAIKSVKNDGLSVHVVAASRRMHAKTLYRHLKRIDEQFPDFSNVSDEQLVKFLDSVSAGGRTVGYVFTFFANPLLIVVFFLDFFIATRKCAQKLFDESKFALLWFKSQ